MLWMTLALIAALSVAANDTLSKRYFSDLKPFEMGLVRLLFASPFLAAGLALLPWPEIDLTFHACFASGKKAILHSSPLFFGTSYFLGLLALMLILFPFVPGAKASNLFIKPLPGIAAGILSAVMVFTHTTAISMIEAAYMISIKRTSLLFGVLFGAIVFHETNIRERLLGTLIMLAGVFLIGLCG